jgi:hypothetical protein
MGDSDYLRPASGEAALMDTWSAAPPSICDDAILTRLLDAIHQTLLAHHYDRLPALSLACVRC